MDGFLNRLRISRHRQFLNTVIDFRRQDLKSPLLRICLIGGNGAGKSSILRSIYSSLNEGKSSVHSHLPDTAAEVSFSESQLFNRPTYCINFVPNAGEFLWTEEFFSDPIHFHGRASEGQLPNPFLQSNSGYLYEQLRGNVLITCPPDGDEDNQVRALEQLPKTSVNEALDLLKAKKTKFIVSQSTVREFWTLLIALIKDREARLLDFQKLPENQDRTIKEVEATFKKDNPEILRELAELWQPLLDRAGLIFDYESASIPVQLNDNLEVFLKPKNSTSQNGHIPYAHLSTGIRSFLFRLGHIFCIQRYSRKPPGILLVDEPENSLHPDFLFDILSHYQKAAPDYQIFMATHSPIVAAQFKPEERFILELDPEEGVTVRKGISPEGDDPNDVLVQDFSVQSLYGPAALASWQRFRELERLLDKESDPETKRNLAAEYLQLGSSYNFRANDEISG